MTITIERDEQGWYWHKPIEKGKEGNFYNRDIWPQEALDALVQKQSAIVEMQTLVEGINQARTNVEESEMQELADQKNLEILADT